MKIGDTIINFSEDEGFAIFSITLIIIGVVSLFLVQAKIENYNESAAKEMFYCLEHTDLTADECDRLF